MRPIHSRRRPRRFTRGWGDIARISSGITNPRDDPDFERLYRAEYAHVLRTVFLICHDLAEAEELTQEAFLRLVRRWDSVRGFDRPGAWVRKVAVRLAVRAVGDRKRRHSAERSAYPAVIDEVDVEVLEAVRQLPGRQRAAVVLHYFEDAPVIRIAEILGCSPATVKVHLFRARQQLSALLPAVNHGP
jgi:RNA polymerase sigma-70 factor (ECF subfamily)